jgi:UPF0755 protein
MLCAVGVGIYLAFDFNAPYSGFGQETFVDLPKGTATQQMAALLQNSGVIRHSWEFLIARALRRSATLQAGEYRFNKPASVMEVFDRLARGDIFYFQLVVPEGKNMFDIAAAVGQLGLFPAAQFLAAARDPASIRDLDPQAVSLEGYLFPNTYRVSRGATPAALCQMMTGKFREVWRGLHTNADIHRTVTLASLVEKEGKLPHERPVIASVFARRLAIGMKLDCDPTTIYAALLDGSYSGALHRSDLESDSPYNTYRHAGLPPGPIANPGVASIQAALHPLDTDYLYFVARADGSGGHNFADTLAAQSANIVKYRKALGRSQH